MKFLPLFSLIASVAGSTASAEVPRVVADIAPVHSLVAQVMDGVSTPDLLIPTGASPHGYALRPSQAAALERAHVVIRVGDELTPWLSGALGALASDAVVSELLKADGVVLRNYRDGDLFFQAGEDDHDHDTDHAVDPHAWLDPENGKAWLSAIAGILTEADAENAETYAANADAGRKKIDQAVADMRATLTQFSGTRYIVHHDAYQYFETRFGLLPVAGVAQGDASAPGPAHIARLRADIRDAGVTCILTEPQLNSSLIESIAAGTDVRLVEIDPVGMKLTPGPDLYPDLLRGLAASLRECL